MCFHKNMHCFSFLALIDSMTLCYCYCGKLGCLLLVVPPNKLKGRTFFSCHLNALLVGLVGTA